MPSSVGEYVVDVGDQLRLQVGPPALTEMTCSIVPSIPACAAGAIAIKIAQSARVARTRERDRVVAPRRLLRCEPSRLAIVMLSARSRIVALAAAACMAAALVGASPAGAQGASGSLVIRPADPGQVWLKLRGRPGRRVRTEFVVANPTPAPQRGTLYPVDARLERGGAFILGQEQALRDDVGAWVSLPRETVSLRPRSRRLLEVTVRVPPDAAPGLHVGGIVLQAPGRVARAPGSGEQILIVTRLGLRIYVHVAAPPSSSGFNPLALLGLVPLALILMAWRLRGHRTRA